MQPALQVLRHAPRHPQNHARAAELVVAQLAQPAVYPLLGVLPDRAGVHENHVGVGRTLHALVPRFVQPAEHDLGVGHVHLAAVGLDVDAPRHGGRL